MTEQKALEVTRRRTMKDSQTFLAQATLDQCIALAEFVSVMLKHGDSGSVHSVVEQLVAPPSSIDYLREVLKTIEWNGGHPLPPTTNPEWAGGPKA